MRLVLRDAAVLRRSTAVRADSAEDEVSRAIIAAMLPRFLAPALTSDQLELDLPADEAHHLARVLRMREGEALLVFNGLGLQRRATVGGIQGARVTLRLDGVAPAAPELPVRVVLAQALLKGDSMDQVVRDATTIGVHEIVPLIASHTEVRLPADRASTRIERWRRVAVSATKQCGRAVVPGVAAPLALPELLSRHPDAARVLLVEPLAEVPSTTLDDLRETAARGVLVLVGPEGGWTPDELETARRSGATLVSLGGRTLRAETVAIAGLPVVLHAMRVWP